MTSLVCNKTSIVHRQQRWCVKSSFACRAEEEARFKAFAAQPELHKKIFEVMAPSIYGHDDIKKAVACLLFGGARKVKLAAFAAPLAALHVQLVHHFNQSNAQDSFRHSCAILMQALKPSSSLHMLP